MRSALILTLLLAVWPVAQAQRDTIIEVNNAQLHYHTFGTGDPILIINGGPGMNSEGFGPLAQLLAEGYQTITYDQRGTGQSTVIPLDQSTITMDLMIADVEALREHLGYEQWTLFGHSFGGMLASYYATQHPDRVKAMILSASGGLDLTLLEYFGDSLMAKLTTEEQESLNYWNEQIRSGDTSYETKLQQGLAMAPAYVYNKAHVPAIGKRMTQGNMAINQLVWNNMMEMRFSCVSEMIAFTKPVLILHGKNDIISIESAQFADGIIPNSTLVLLDKCGHYGWLDQEEKYVGAISEFLSNIK